MSLCRPHMEASASAQASRAAPPVSPRAPKPESPPDPTPSHQPVAALTVQVPPSASSSSLQAVRSSSSGVLGEPLPGIGAGTGAVAHVYAADVGVTLQAGWAEMWGHCCHDRNRQLGEAGGPCV